MCFKNYFTAIHLQILLTCFKTVLDVNLVELIDLNFFEVSNCN